MDVGSVKIYRRRYIPDEKILLKNDEVLHIDENIIVTKWKTLKPRADFDHGYSCYYLKKGMKISKFYSADNKLLFHYCDIIETCYDENENTYVFNDLLADVIVYENGLVKVLDIGEIAYAIEEGLITVEQAKNALRILDELLNIIYSGKFDQLMLIPFNQAVNLQ